MSTRRYDHNESYDIILSNQTIIILCTVGFASLGIAVYFLILRHVPSSSDDNNDETLQNYDEFLDQTDVATLNRAERRARAKLHMKKARRAVPAVQRDNDADGGRQNDDQLNEGDGQMKMAEGATLSRKERQKAAKALEKEERKKTAAIARSRREADQKKQKKQMHEGNDKADESASQNSASQLRLEEIFPPRESGSNDPLSDYLFHESITNHYRDNPQSFLDDCIHTKKMTIRTFINKLQNVGSVSVSALADDFRISIDEAMNELNKLNEVHGVIGVFDKMGNFIFVSQDMIKMAVEIGRGMGRIPFPVESFGIEGFG